MIGSPSSTSGLTIDILGTASTKSLVGNICVFEYTQDGKEHFALGQINEVTLQNIWTQDPTMRGIIRQKGQVYPITERQDVHTANMSVSSVFANHAGIIGPSMLGTVPSTGTMIKLLDEGMMQSLLGQFSNELFYLGKAYGTSIKMPMWFKHFGKGAQSAQEAYHIGIFGKTGSGKSIMSIMMTIGYARHKEMSIFILDPQGQFTKEFKKEPIKQLFEKNIERTIEFINLHNMVLSGDELFEKILINSNFLRNWASIKHPENQKVAFRIIKNILKGNNIKPWDYHKDESFGKVWGKLSTDDHLHRVIYTSDESRQTMANTMESANLEEVRTDWRKITNLFSYGDNGGKKKIKDLVESLLIKQTNGKILIIDLCDSNIPPDIYWTEDIKHIIIGELLSELSKAAENQYKEEKLLNTLVIIDEAHRLAPRDKFENEQLEYVKSILIDSIRTTRKYGLGWLFISQSLSSLHKEIINQLRIYVFGYGLAWGVEYQALRELMGGQEEAIKLYRLFKDPHTSLGDREYSFMTQGPISPLSFSGTPLFITSLKYDDEFIRVNFQNTSQETPTKLEHNEESTKESTVDGTVPHKE